MDFIITIAVTAFVSGAFNALANFFVYKFVLKNLKAEQKKDEHPVDPKVTEAFIALLKSLEQVQQEKLKQAQSTPQSTEA
jgi:hypothetical protein